MPEIDVKASVALLAVSALTGGLLLVMTGITLLAPSWWWVQATRHQKSLKSQWWFGLPTARVILGLILIAFLKPEWVKWSWVVPLPIALITSLCLLFSKHTPRDNVVYTSADICRPYRIKVSPKSFIYGLKRPWKQGFRQRLVVIGYFNLGFLLSFYYFVLLFPIAIGLVSNNPDFQTNARVYFMLSMIVIWLCNLVMVRAFSTPRYLAIAATILLFIIRFCIRIGGPHQERPSRNQHKLHPDAVSK